MEKIPVFDCPFFTLLLAFQGYAQVLFVTHLGVPFNLFSASNCNIDLITCSTRS